ncbi:MAG: hypothetical protein DHS20C11_07380 [Lysobacteraceae bacterium]|nr:MAG: hypothetical protein DHS20C11_07380 [Xanthomonadaceae bacterium]
MPTVFQEITDIGRNICVVFDDEYLHSIRPIRDNAAFSPSGLIRPIDYDFKLGSYPKKKGPGRFPDTWTLMLHAPIA